MKYNALFVIFEKVAKLFNCRLLQMIGGALRVKQAPMGWKKGETIKHTLALKAPRKKIAF